MLCTNNIVFLIVHAPLRLRRLAAALHFLDIVFPRTMSLVGGITGGMAAHITDMATKSSGSPLASCFSASAGRLPLMAEQDTTRPSSLASSERRVMSVKSNMELQ
jgi:hypothetical protein